MATLRRLIGEDDGQIPVFQKIIVCFLLGSSFINVWAIYAATSFKGFE